jgi:imidazolonepropionase
MKATLVIKNIDKLITLKGENRPRAGEDLKDIGLIEGGVIAVKDDEIIYVGKGELPDDIETDENTKFIDGKGKTITPGLIDSHTHLVHGGSRENELDMKLKGAEYLDILAAGGGIHSTMDSTKNASFDELYEKAKKSLNTMLSFGVTTVEGKSGYGIEDFDTELRQLEVNHKLNEDHPVDIISTFMGAHSIPKRYEDDPEKFVDIIINEMLPVVEEKNLAEFCDIFCEEGIFSIDQSRRILLAAREHGMKLKIHADEIVTLGGAELAAEIGCVSADHLLAASDKGLEALANSNTIATLLPGTAFNLGADFANARKMIDMGVPVALSTDYNPGSCPTENLQFIMTLSSLKMRMTPEEVIAGVTINAAAALDMTDKIGSLQKGKKADIAIFDAPNLPYIIYHFGINHIDKVIKNGKLIFEKQELSY